MRIYLTKEGLFRKGTGSFPVRTERGMPVLIDARGKLTIMPDDSVKNFRFVTSGEVRVVASDAKSVTVEATSSSPKSAGRVAMVLDNLSYEILVFAGNWDSRPARPEYPPIGEIADGYIVSAPELGLPEIEAL